MQPTSSHDLEKLINESTAKRLQSFTGAETKKEGIFLIAISIVSILLTFNLVAIGKGSIQNFEINISVPILKTLMHLVCLYYFLLFSIDAFSDWKSIPVYEIENLNELMTQQVERQIADNKEINKEIESRQAIRDQMMASILTTMEPTGAVAVAEGIKETHERMLLFQSSLAMQREIDLMQKRYDDHCKNDGLDELREQVKKMALERKLLDVIQVWIKNRRTISIISKLRFFIEVLFPIGLGAVALALVIVAKFHQ